MRSRSLRSWPWGSVLAALLVVGCSKTERTGNQIASASVRPTTSTAASPPTGSIVPPPPVGPGAMAPRLRALGSELLLTWIEPVASSNAQGRAKRHRVRFSRLAEATWTPATTISEGAEIVANWADAPSAMRGGDGALVASWAEKSGDKAYAYDVVLGRSVDGGASWKRLGLAHDDGTASEHGFVSLVPEANGVRAFWLDGRLTASKDAGGHAGSMTLRTGLVSSDGVPRSELVDSRTCDCCGTSAVATSRGPLVAYRDRSETEVRDIAVVRRGGGDWGPPRPLHDDGWIVPGCPVNGPMLAVEGDRVAAAWYTYVKGQARVRAAFSRDGGVTFGDATEVAAPAGRSAPIGRVDIVSDGDGAVVSWLSSEREEATIVVARVAPDGRVGDRLTVARTEAGRQSGFPQLERLGDRLVMAWTEPGEPSRVALKTVRLADLAAPSARRSAPKIAGSRLLAAGAEAPDYRAHQLDGRDVSLSSLRGKVVLLNLWATWCEPCRHELGALKALHQRFSGKDVAVVAVSLDADRDAVARYVERRDLPFAVWHDPRDRASAAFGVDVIPATFVIDAAGTIAWSKSGAVSEGEPGLVEALEAAGAHP